MKDSSELNAYHEDRPWGSFDQFTHNLQSTVKLITVNPGQSTSLQYHNHRSEFWVVISGEGFLHIGDDVFEAKPGERHSVIVGKTHRIQSTDEPLVILEISTGDFDEQDIIRVEDQYGREVVSNNASVAHGI